MPLNHNPADGEKRGRGRPKKGEVVTKPLVVHRRLDIKPENAEKYAQESIKTAVNIYRKYGKDFPNPLNLDVKDLTPEAQKTWEYIFSLRGYTGDDAFTHSEYEKTFYTADEVLFAFECYCNFIRDHNFSKAFTRPDGEQALMPIVPNQTNFARWLGVATFIIGRMLSEDGGAARDKYMSLLADCLSEGAMAGFYQAGSTQFALKNMCDWADKYEDKSAKRDTLVTVNEAEAIVQKLGYTREKATLPPLALEENANG